MERESFESDKIGTLLNENFVSIKVDREERPDVDRVYMTFIQVSPSPPLSIAVYRLYSNLHLLILTQANEASYTCTLSCSFLVC